MKTKKWLKPVIVIAVIVALCVVGYQVLMNYLSSRGVLPTMDDVISTAKMLSSYLIVLGVILAVCLIVAIAVTFIKMKRSTKGLIRWESLVAALIAVVVTVNVVCMGPEYSLLNNALGDTYSLSAETVSASEQLVKDIADEGIVLLKNEGNALPLSNTKKLNVFGWSSTSPIYGGTGSGSVDTSTCVTLLQGLKDAGYELNQTIIDFYDDFTANSYFKKEFNVDRPPVEMGGQDWTIPEPTMEEYDNAGIFENAKEFSDTAVIVIARTGGENADLPTSITDEDTFEYVGGWSGYSGVRYTAYADDVDPGKSYLELSNREIAMVERVCSEFSNVVVVINSANAMELGWLDRYDAIKGAVWMAGPGQTGFGSLGRVLNGTVNPSGHLVDTYAYDLLSIPAINYVGNYKYIYPQANAIIATETASWLSIAFTNYVEGIYVGYKFYETMYAELKVAVDAATDADTWYASAVQYPFGYGLSYTTFDQKLSKVENDGKTVTLTVTVTNTGSVAGKEVVQVYFDPPYTVGGIEKAAANLINFEKTNLLQPGESQDVTVSFAVEDMASYDSEGIKAEGGAYVLEKGDYTVSINKDAHNVIDSTVISIDRDYIYNDANDGARDSDKQAAVNQFDFAKGDVTYLSRANCFANYEAATAAPASLAVTETLTNGFYCQNTYDPSAYDAAHSTMPTTGAKNGLTLRDMVGVSYDDAKWDKLLDELTVDEMTRLIGLGGYANAKIDSIDLPATVECDGPAAIKNNFTGESGTAYPAATMIAATWSKELARKRGESMGQQCQDMNVVGWYGPAMNIHRTPFSGRNFEYYSEDGVLSGYMGANEVLGASKYGVQCYIKHFALNDSEAYRKNALCTWTNEQAMREVFMKSFELSVKVGGASNAMTAFNYIGNQWAGSCEALLQTVLRGEWGFVGSTVTDWFNGTTDGIMLADSAIRVGGDKMLSSSGDVKANPSNTDNAGTVTAMRAASKNILYSLADSNAMDDRNFATPGWVNTFRTADIICGVVLLLLEAYIILSFLKRRKAEK